MPNGAKVQIIGDLQDGKVLFKFLDGDRKDQEDAIEPQFIEFQAQDSNEVDKVDSIEQNQPASNLSEFIKKVFKGEKVFVKFQRNKKNKPKNKQYFDHLQSRRIKKKLDLFKKNPDDVTNCQVNLGFYSIDFKTKKVYQTGDPANSEEHFEFAEATAHERERSDPSRFITNITDQSLKQGNDGGRENKLGSDWGKKYKTKTGFPSLNQILSGLKEQEKVQLLLTSGLHPSSEEFHEALEGLQEAWESYFEELGPIIKY